MGIPTSKNTPNTWLNRGKPPPATLLAIHAILGAVPPQPPSPSQDQELEDSLAYVRRELARALACASPSARREIIRHLKAQVTLLANLAAAGGLFGDGGHEASGPRRAAPG